MEKGQEPSCDSKKVTAIIACSKSKRNRACAARFLYTGSLFKKALVYAEKNYKYVYILSAKFGILHPDHIIEPYNKTLLNMSTQEKNKWYLLVGEQLKTLKKPLTFFTGRLYNYPFEGFKPLEGLGLGEQLKWFNIRLKKRKGFFS